MGGVSSSATFTSLLLFISLSLYLLIPCATHETTLKGVDLGHPVVDVTPVTKHVSLCERVKVSGRSRWELESYASSFHVTLAPSVEIPEGLHSQIHICFHRNALLGLCQCEKNEWENVKEGLWNSVMSPYEDRYIDVMFTGENFGSVRIAVKEGFQLWRLLYLAVGFVILLLAPIISSWVPFYYTCAFGASLVISIILFQGLFGQASQAARAVAMAIMLCWKSKPLGFLCLELGFFLYLFLMLVNLILLIFGLPDVVRNLVDIFVVVGIILALPAFGYWIVRKFVISKDGSVDVSIAQFVKWAMRIVAITFIFQSTLDIPLATGALVSCWATCNHITSPEWRSQVFMDWKNFQQSIMELNFLARSPKMGSRRKMWNSPKSSPALSNSPVKDKITNFSPLAMLLDENRLKGPNYGEWKRNLNIMLTAEKLMHVLNEDVPEVPAKDATQDAIDAYNLWHKHDSLAKCYILASLENRLQKQHETLLTAREIMNSLNKMFEQQNRFARQAAMKGLMSTKMAVGTSVDDHVMKMIGFINELESLGFEMDNDTKIDAILSSLPDSFKQFVLNYNMNNMVVTLSELRNMLQRAEDLIKKGKPSEGVLRKWTK